MFDDLRVANLAELGSQARSWPYQEAARLNKRLPEKQETVIFETGYGPSGLPHLGTFSEVLRTHWVRLALSDISARTSKLIAFSDDMDGLRKVPENVPNQSMMREHLGLPLSSIPDPFETHASFAEHNNQRLCAFLNQFGFDYTFTSATTCYRSGAFDTMLLKALDQFDTLVRVVLPSLGEERRATYSPFMPICPLSGKVLQVPTLERNIKKGTIVFLHPNGKKMETPVTGGHCKLQWRPDWALRWAALKVDYELYGKDLIPSADLAGKMARAFGAKKPDGFVYEHFLDENGAKISKSIGNGISMEEWLNYAPEESLGYYLFTKPRSAKRLFFDAIPKCVDEIYRHAAQSHTQSDMQRIENPAWFVFRALKNQEQPVTIPDVSFSILLNLATVCHAQKAGDLWTFLSRTQPHLKRTDSLDRLLSYAIRYSKERVIATLKRQKPDKQARLALEQLAARLKTAPQSDPESLQSLIFEVGKNAQYDPLRLWFTTLYRCLLGQESGPRMGSFFSLYGVENSVKLIEESLLPNDS